MRRLALALAPLLLTLETPAFAQAPSWRVTEVTGDVRVTDAGRSRAATRGTLLSAGSTIATAARARAVLVRGQEYVVVSPNSRLRLPAAEGQGRQGVIQMLTDWGTALFRIERRATAHFGVQTPYLAAVVKGTVFTVTVGRSGASVQVTEGAVEVSTVDGGAAELVRPGMVAMVASSDLLQLNIEGETSRTIRSNGVPAAGVVTIPAPEVGRYEGPADTPTAISATVTEGAVSLGDVTDGLVAGRGGTDLALADVRDVVRDRADDSGPVADAGNGGGGDATDSPGNGGGSASPGTGAGDDGNNGGGNDDGGADSSNPGNGGGTDNSGAGSGGDDGNNGGGNDDDGADSSNPGNGGGGDTSGSGSGGDDDDGNNGGGNDDDGDDSSNPGNGGGGDTSGSGSGGDDDDGNNGGGNDDGGADSSNPGNGGDNDNSGPGNSGGGNDDDDNSGSGSGGGNDNSGPGNNNGGGNDDDDNSGPGNNNGGGNDDDDDDDGGNICLLGDLLCVGPGGGDDDDDD